MKRIVTRALIILAATLGIVFTQFAPASAAPPDDPSNVLASDIVALWTAVLETPASQNKFIGNDLPACWDLGHKTIVQFGPPGPNTDVRSCTVKPGTKIFVPGWSTECSTIPGDDGGPGLSEDQLRTCAAHGPNGVDKKIPTTATIDGKKVPLSEVDTPAMKIDLPEDNILGAPKGEYLSVADGLVALLPPQTPGEHEIVIVNNVGAANETATTTKIVVTR